MAPPAASPSLFELLALLRGEDFEELRVGFLEDLADLRPRLGHGLRESLLLALEHDRHLLSLALGEVELLGHSGLEPLPEVAPELHVGGSVEAPVHGPRAVA